MSTPLVTAAERTDDTTAERPDDTTAERRAKRNWWIAVLALTLGALVVRVVYILVFRTDTIDNLLPNGQPYVTRVWGDGLVYHKQANLLVDGKGLIAPLPYELLGVTQQSADHPPLYVLYLAIFSALGLRGDLTHMLVSAPIGALTALSFGLLGRRVWSPRVGIIAAAIGAFSPSMIHYPGFILSETISIPLIAAFTLFLYRLWDDPSFRNAIGAGVFLGLAILSRAEVAMVVPVAVIPLVAMLRGLRPTRKFWLLCACGASCAALVLPWVGYNLSRYEKPVYLSVGMDYALAQGNCDQTYYGDLIGFYWLDCMGQALEGTDLVFADQSLGASHLREVGLDYIKAHKSRALLVAAARVGRVTGVYRPIQQSRLESFIENRDPWLSNASVLTYYPLAVSSIAGALVLRRRKRLVLPLVALVGVTLFATAITLAVLRYRVSAEPTLAVFSAVALQALGAWCVRAWRDRDPLDETLEVSPPMLGARAG
jgi:4-amino-4-deoxy-L-arabinose transferase-like glycosyltransferase